VPLAPFAPCAPGCHCSPVEQPILTPDQRLRVFISSTMRELAEERSAAADAIRELRLTPVLFELGARDHPPRDLYRAYLDQSQVFVGIYGEQYGWVAPDMGISGIEDEYLLSGDRPKLIYVKEPAPARDERLQAMLSRIMDEAKVCFESFSSEEELHALVGDDLAVVLSERFAKAPAAALAAELPVSITSFVGREDDLQAVRRMVLEEGTHLLTLTGPGGIGKSRLALEAIGPIAPSFPDGVVPVFLSSITDPAEVPAAIAAALGLPESPERSPLEVVTAWLRDRRALLILDEFEHLIPAAQVVSELLRGCPELKILATSRESLKLGGEHKYEVGPLGLPPEGYLDEATACDSEAVRLFVERAEASSPSFSFGGNEEAVARICRRLDGLPLAIELAAARVGLLSPEALLERLDESLDLLRGPRDLPEHQQTLRATVDWSYDLLSEEDRILFARLSVFKGGWTLPAAEAVCGEGIDVLEGMSSLLGKSLVQSAREQTGEPRFSMLRLIQDVASEHLAASGEEERLREAHASYFEDLCGRAAEGFKGTEFERWAELADTEFANLTQMFEWLLEHGRAGRALTLLRETGNFAWARGHMIEFGDLAERALEGDPELRPEEEAAAYNLLGARASWTANDEEGIRDTTAWLLGEATAFHEIGSDWGLGDVLLELQYYSRELGPDVRGVELCEEAERLLLTAGDRWAVATAKACRGFDLLEEGKLKDAEDALQDALAFSREFGGKAVALALEGLGLLRLMSGESEEARSLMLDALRSFVGCRGFDGIAESLEELVCAFASTDPARAAVLFGAASRIWDTIGATSSWEDFRLLDEAILAVEQQLGKEEFETRKREGASLSMEALLELAAGD